MKLISYKANGKDCYGVVNGDGIVDASARLGDTYPTLRDVIAAVALDQLVALENESPDHALDDIDYELPIPNVQKIMCAGRNYRAYHEVVEEGGPLQYPSIFGRFVSGFSPHNQDILDPKAGEQFDYEGELVAVIGKGGRHISEDDALGHVVGYTIMNEGSVRDWMAMGTQNTPAKNFYRSGGIGPWIVTKDEVGDPAEQHIYTRRNGTVMQDAGTDLMIFDTKYLDIEFAYSEGELYILQVRAIVISGKIDLSNVDLSKSLEKIRLKVENLNRIAESDSLELLVRFERKFIHFNDFEILHLFRRVR